MDMYVMLPHGLSGVQVEAAEMERPWPRDVQGCDVEYQEVS